MKKYFAIGGFIILTYIYYGCGGSATNSNVTGVNHSADTLPDVTEFLLDTIYPSASDVEYSVTVFDTLMSGKLDTTADAYSNAPGVFTFRGNSMRNSGCVGTLSGQPREIKVEWSFDTDEDFTETEYGMWGGGTGWTGQPLYVHWPDSMLGKLKAENLVENDFSGHEIMVGSLCMKAYFIDFETGLPSRDPIDVGNPIKGTMSLDPALNGNLYFGQGVPAYEPFGTGVIDLWRNKVTDFFDRDSYAWRGWGAYDSSPLKVGQFLFRPGENGTLYKLSVKQGKLYSHSTLRYRVNGVSPGIEASMCQWLDRGYIADNHGNVICVNLNDLIPIWHYSLGDDVDCTPVLSIENNNPYLYLGCEVDRFPNGPAKFVKINAIDGNPLWERQFPAVRRNVESKHFDGGFYATSLLGRGDCSGIIFCSCVNNNDGKPDGTLLALDCQSGDLRYKVPMKVYGWSSPVGFLDRNNKFYVLVGDCAGQMMLLDGIDGSIIDCKQVGINFESSPVVVGNSVVVGSRGKKIYKIKVI